MSAYAPIPSISIDALLAARDELLATLVAFDERLAKATEAIGRFDVRSITVELAFLSGRELRFTGFEGHRLETEDARREIDRSVWEALFRRSGLDDLMDKQTRDDFYSGLHGRAHYDGRTEHPPALTRENIEATMRGIGARADEFFGKAVESVYRRLSWNYKTNAPYRLGERMIVSTAYEYWQTPDSTGCLSHLRPETLGDLYRCLCVVAGEPLPTHTTGLGALKQIRIGEWFDVPPTGKRVLLSAKVFKNRNAHVRLHIPEAVDALNRIMAARRPFSLGDGYKRGAA